MLRQLEDTLALSSAGSPAKAFWRLGWIGFWTQIGFGSLPVVLIVYALIFGTRAGNPLIGLLTFADLLLSAAPAQNGVVPVPYGVVLPVHTAGAAASRSGTTAIPFCRAASSMDWGGRRCSRHRVFDACHVI